MKNEDFYKTVDFLIRRAALRPENALEEFSISLYREIELCKASVIADLTGVDAKAATTEFDKLIWPQIFKYICDAQIKTPDDFKLPFLAWKSEAEKMAVIFARDFAKVAPIEEIEFKKKYSAFKKKVTARTNKILSSWPVSKDDRSIVVKFMIAAAEDAIMETLSRGETPSAFRGRQ